MKDVCTIHHKLMADVAVLLRTIARMENFHFPAIPKFLARFSRFRVCLITFQLLVAGTRNTARRWATW